MTVKSTLSSLCLNISTQSTFTTSDVKTFHWYSPIIEKIFLAMNTTTLIVNFENIASRSHGVERKEMPTIDVN